MKNKRKLIWCHVHQPTEIQLKELNEIGDVEYLKDINHNLLDGITNCPNNVKGLRDLAIRLLHLTTMDGYDIVQPAGSPAFQFILGSMRNEQPFVRNLFNIFYAHSDRVSEEITLPNGTVEKKSIFKHMFFIKIK